jgi:hypothetical protein
MKKVKQKQKQKQSQTVNINLGNVLKKKSKPRRKPQPKQFNSSQSSGGPSISFNAPPIREYIDTSLNNRPSTLESPLLLKNTTNQQSTELGFPIQNNNPLLNQPPQQKSIAYNLGQYLLQSNIPDSQMQQNMLYIKQGYENQEISNIEEENKKNKIQSNFKKQQEAIMSQIPDDIKNSKQRKELKKAESIRRNELLKAEKKKLNEEKKNKKNIGQTDIPSFFNVEQPQTIFSAPQEPQTITSAPPQQENKTSLPIFYQMQTESNLPTEQYVPNMSPQEELARNKKITSAPQEPQTITSAPPQQESITSSLPIFYQMQTESNLPTEKYVENRSPEEILAFYKHVNKAPPKKVAKPIKMDADGNPIKKPKTEKPPKDAPKKLIIPPP